MFFAEYVSICHAYGLSMNACQLIVNYLKDRRRLVKVMCECSDWTIANRGVPRCSGMGPLLFNIFLDNLFNVKMICEIADDNHLYYAQHCDIALKSTLDVDKNSAIDWFINIYMDANRHTFQKYCLGQKQDIWFSISVQENLIVPKTNYLDIMSRIVLPDNIKLLGVILNDQMITSSLYHNVRLLSVCLAVLIVTFLYVIMPTRIYKDMYLNISPPHGTVVILQWCFLYLAWTIIHIIHCANVYAVSTKNNFNFHIESQCQSNGPNKRRSLVT